MYYNYSVVVWVLICVYFTRLLRSNSKYHHYKSSHFKVHALNIIIAYPFQCKRRVFKSNNMPSCRFGIWSFLIVMYFNFYKTKNFKEAVINTLWNNNSYVNNTLYFVFNNLYCTTMIKIFCYHESSAFNRDKLHILNLF